MGVNATVAFTQTLCVSEKMKKLIRIILIISGVVSILNLVIGLSFSKDLIDLIFLVVFIVSCVVFLTLKIQRTRFRIVFVLIVILGFGFGWVGWQLFGYESRTDTIWMFNDHNVELEYRLHIAGPGVGWFLFNKELLGGFVERRIESRRYQAGMPNPPEIFTFTSKRDTFEIECCKKTMVQVNDSTWIGTDVNFLEGPRIILME